MQNQYSLRSPAVKRLMREAQELKEATETYYAHPLEDNLFEWHFTIRGPEDTEFVGGIYHGRIILPPDYPMKPPSIILLTPNGRFEIFKKICLSISGHHPESWQPSWSIRTALLAIIGFMPTHGNGAIGSLNYTPDERKVLARRSMEFKCTECGPISTILKPVTAASKESNEEAKRLAQQINFQAEKEKKGGEGQSKSSASSGDGVTAAAGDTQPGQTGAGTTPGFPMPPMGFPPFMQQAFRPPVTSGTNIPPQFFMPPFWPPGNNLQQQQLRFSQQPQQSNNQRIANPFWPPPGFMMPPGMVPAGMVPPGMVPAGMAPPSGGVVTSPSQPVGSVKSQVQSAPDSAGSSTVQAGQSASSTSTTSSEGSSSPVSSSSTESTARLDEADRSEASSSSAFYGSASTTPSTSATSTAEDNPTTPTVRQRQVGQATVSRSQLPHRVQRTNQSAELVTRQQRSGGSGCIGVLMVVIGLALALLIFRRLYIMNLLNFDFNF